MIARLGAILVLAIAALAAPAADVAPLAAQEPPVSVTTTVERDGRTIGDPITILITVRHPPGATIALSPDPLALGALESAVPRVTEPAAGTDPTTTTIALETRAFVTGAISAELPEISVIVDGRTVRVLPRIDPIDVLSVLPEDAASVSPRPLKPAETIDGAPVSIEIILAPIVAVLALGVVALWWRRWRRPALPQLAPPPPDPAVAARTALSELSQSGLLPARIREFSRGVDQAVRAFLEARYDIPALALTSSELPPRLSAAGASAGTVRMVRNLALETDAVEYGGANPSPARAARLVDLARAIVDPAQDPPDTATTPPERWERPDPTGTRGTDGEGA